ncbi:MAG: helix-turn-helix transcriptional regulator [Bacteroidales bacterium]
MIDRIRLLIETQNLTASQFADIIKVQRSGLSHILSGRNNASLDFVQKVLTKFPEVSPDWLINGEGPMFRKKQKQNEEVAEKQDEPSLFSSVSREEKKGIRESEPDSLTQSLAKEKEDSSKSEVKQTGAIDRIIILYKDGFFKDYYPHEH